MIDLKKDNECTVCGKCVLACPAQAISYEIGEYGNYMPVINRDKCKECHICERVCAEQKYGEETENYCEKRHYIGYIDDKKILDQSSSGGIFSAVALWILSQQGIVIGASYDEHTLQVRHIAVSNERELQRLRKSKYVQSDWVDSCKMVAEAIQEKKWVLFSGTACQVKTVKEFFGNYEKIVLLDIFCHGVAMAGMFQEYMQMPEQEGVTSIDFRRHTSDGGSNFRMYMKSDNGIHEEPWGQNMFCSLYINSAIMKRACLSCKYAEEHVADITIGDFCDFNEYALEQRIAYPLASIFSINTEKGAEVFSLIKEKLVYSELEDESIIGHYYRKHADIHGDWGWNEDIWEQFHCLYQKKGFTIAALEVAYQNELNLIREIDKIKTKRDELMLYGAGTVGRRLLSVIKRMRKQWRVKCYLVSDCGKEKWIEGIPVIPLRETIIDEEKMIVVIAVSPLYRKDIICELNKIGITRFV